MLGTLDARCLVDQDSQRFTSAIKAIGQKAGIRFVQRVVGVVKLSSLGHDEYVLSVSLQPRHSVAGGGASGGLAGA